MKSKDYKIVPFKTDRFAVVDKNNNIIDDAQGYGYTTKQKAHKVVWYKFQGGKKKIQKKVNRAKFWINETEENKIAFKSLENFYCDFAFEIAKGEVGVNEIINHIQIENGLIFPDYVIEYFFKH